MKKEVDLNTRSEREILYKPIKERGVKNRDGQA